MEIFFSNGNLLFDTTPEVQEVSTSVSSNMVTGDNNTLNENSLLDATPKVQEFATPVPSNMVTNPVPSNMVTTPVPSNMVTKENDTLNETTCTDNCDDSLNCEVELISPIWGKYVSKKDFHHKNNTNEQEVLQILKQIRVKNIDRVIIDHLNVNFFAKKIDAIKTIIPSNVDLMVFSETKLDSSYPIAQLLIEGFGKPFRLDRNAFGGGILIYVRSDIPCKQVNKQDKILLTGDFNAEESEDTLRSFMELYDFKNLVKENTCFKSVENPSCVDLFLTNCIRSFQNTTAISTGISDCYKMIIRVLKTTFKKSKKIIYRSYRNYNPNAFNEELGCELDGCTDYKEYENRILRIWNTHAPLKQKLVRANEVPYMTKTLRKAIANRSRLENRYYKENRVKILEPIKSKRIFVADFIKGSVKSAIPISI